LQFLDFSTCPAVGMWNTEAAAVTGLGFRVTWELGGGALRSRQTLVCGVSFADIAHCPSCSLLLRVIYDEEALTKLSEAG
jgi:hypothetical protein